MSSSSSGQGTSSSSSSSSSSMAHQMDVETPALSLKRWSSAPMINGINPGPNSTGLSSPSSSSSSTAIREPKTVLQRPRRFSTSCSPLPPFSGPSSPKLTHRVNQLRREETVDVLGREAAHERELNSVMSLSWEDLTLVPESKGDAETNGGKTNNGQSKNKGDLQLSLTGDRYPLSSTPSPTRSNTPLRHCLPTFKTSLTPSPTRTFSRSQSPIAMRPSTLGNSVKRKFELEDNYEPPAKKFGSLIIQQSRVEEPMVVGLAAETTQEIPKEPSTQTAETH